MSYKKHITTTIPCLPKDGSQNTPPSITPSQGNLDYSCI